MGFWSSVKKAAKRAWRAVKATVRAVVKIVIEIVIRVINFVLVWLPIQKKMRLQVFILRDESGNPLVGDIIIFRSINELQAALDYTIKTFKDRFDIKIKSYGNPIIQTLPDPAPSAALDVKCDAGAASNEWGEAGEYFSNNLAGWHFMRIHLAFPIAVFIVRNVAGKLGCSLGPLTDCVAVSIAGARSPRP